MYIHVQQHVSKRARDLGDRLADVIRDAKKQDKKLSYQEVSQATRLATFHVREELGGMSNNIRILIVIGMIVAVTLAGALIAIFNR